MAKSSSLLITVVLILVVVLALWYVATKSGFSFLGSSSANRMGTCCIARYSGTAYTNVCIPTDVTNARCNQVLKGRFFSTKGACDKFVFEQPNAGPCSK